jgi:hypothetical protein
MLEVKGKGIRWVGGAADKEAHTVHSFNIISQRQYFVVRGLISFVNVFGLHRKVFFFYPQASDVGKAHSLVPGTVLALLNTSAGNKALFSSSVVLVCIQQISHGCLYTQL